MFTFRKLDFQLALLSLRMEKKWLHGLLVLKLVLSFQVFTPLAFAGKETDQALEVSSQHAEIISQLGHSVPRQRTYYMGGEFSRGYFDYGLSFSESLWENLIALGKDGKILDAGCGEANLAVDLYSSKLNIEKQLTYAHAKIRYWPGKAPKKYRRFLELSASDYERYKEFFENFRTLLKNVRKNPPQYVGLSTRGLVKRHVLKHIDVFSNPRVRITTGSFFSDLSPEMILGDGKKFDVITDIFGVLTYSTNLEVDAYKMLSLLKVGGKLFVKTDASAHYISAWDKTKHLNAKSRVFMNQMGELKKFSDWFYLGTGIRVLKSSDDGSISTFVIEKTNEEITLPKLATQISGRSIAYTSYLSFHTFEQ
jgi:SAM-dependent methyltransferase